MIIWLMLGFWLMALVSPATASGTEGGDIDQSYTEYNESLPLISLKVNIKPDAPALEKSIHAANRRQKFYKYAMTQPGERENKFWKKMIDDHPELKDVPEWGMLQSIWDFVNWYEVINAATPRVNFHHGFEFATGEPTQIYEEGFTFATEVQEFPNVRNYPPTYSY